MNKSYNIYCVSDTEFSNNNKLSYIKNFLPQNLDLKNDQWEIGIVKCGFQLDTEKTKDLSIVSILTDVVIDSPNGNKYSTLIYDTSLSTSAKDKYFNTYVKYIKYYPIRSTFIDSITVKFVDVNGKDIHIKKDHLSFVHFHLRTRPIKENYKMNYIRLDSENTNLEKKNTNNNFWVHLKDTMELNENSEVALLNINFPNSIKNINSSLSKKQIKILLRTNEDGDFTYYLNIPADYYSSALDLVQILNLKLPKKLKTILKFNSNNEKLEIISTHNNSIVLEFPIEFKNILGFDTDIPSNFLEIKNNKFISVILLKNSKYVTNNPINVMYKYPNAMLSHANFVKHSIVGNSYFPILKMIPIPSPNKDNYISVHFDHLEFVKTNVEYLKDLHFELRQLNGDFIEFADNRKTIINCVVKIK